MHKRALALKNLRHISAKRLREQKDQPKENRNLQYAEARHFILSKSLRPEQRVNKVYEQTQR